MPRAPIPLLLAAASGCFAPGEPFPVDVEITPTEITLPTATYQARPARQEVRVRNVLGSDIYISAAFANASGDTPDLLLVELPSRQIELPAFTVISPGTTASLGVTLNETPWRWDSGSYRAVIPFEVRYFFSGQSPDEAESPSDRRAPDPQAGLFELVVNYSFDCDLDQDGFEAMECGGDDCDDADARTHPGADEDCADDDRDCDGGLQDGATDTRTYYRDRDNDTYGDPDTTVVQCANPDPLEYVERAGDCNDTQGRVNPNETEQSELCNDGFDNDCDGSTDDEDPGCQ